MHDFNLSGYWFLLWSVVSAALGILIELIDQSIIQSPVFVVAIIIILYAIFLLSWLGVFFVKGVNGSNKYGLDPLRADNLRLPRLSKRALFLVFGPAIIGPLVLSWQLFSAKGFQKGLEVMKENVMGLDEDIKERQMEKKRQCELLIKKCEGMSEGDTGSNEEQDTEGQKTEENNQCAEWLIKRCKKMLEEGVEEGEDTGESQKEGMGAEQ